MLPGPSALDGVAWERGPVLLSWEAIRDERRGPSWGRNVVVHEFAHHLDGLNGRMEGVPPMTPTAERRWEEIVAAEMTQLQDDVREDYEGVLAHGGAESKAEFFAVASEAFFEWPHALRREHADLHAALAEFYQQDPATWLPRPD